VRSYLRFLVWGVVAVAVVALLGYLPTQRLAGSGAIPAIFAGCSVGILSAALGALPIVFAGSSPAAKVQAGLLTIGVRFGSVLLLGLAAVLSGRFERRPLVVWVAVSYVVLLVIESRYAVAALNPTGALNRADLNRTETQGGGDAAGEGNADR
jgi:hypothetical protein